MVEIGLESLIPQLYMLLFICSCSCSFGVRVLNYWSMPIRTHGGPKYAKYGPEIYIYDIIKSRMKQIQTWIEYFCKSFLFNDINGHRLK